MGILIRRRGLIAAQPHRATASGSLVHVDRAEPAPLSCVVGIEAVQSGSGTPSPSNVRPISGWTGAGISVAGKNLFDKNTEEAGYINASGVVVVDTSSMHSALIPVNPGETYTFSGYATGIASGASNKRIHAYDADGNWLQQVAYVSVPAFASLRYTVSGTVPSNARYIAVSYLIADNNEQVEPGSTATAYTPYSGSTVSVAFPALGKNLLDPSKKTASSTNGRFRWYEADGLMLRANQAYTFSVSGSSQNITLYFFDKTTGDAIVSALTTVTYTPTADTLVFLQAYRGDAIQDTNVFQLELGSTATTYEPYTNTVYGGTLDTETGVLTVTHGQIAAYAGETLPGAWVSDRDVYAAGAMPTAGAQVVYELATPLTYQLPPTALRTLRGVNNIFADCGNIAATYWTH